MSNKRDNFLQILQNHILSKEASEEIKRKQGQNGCWDFNLDYSDNVLNGTMII